MDDKVLEQILNINHLIIDISFDVNKDIQNKVMHFNTYFETNVKLTLKNKRGRDKKIKFYKTMAVPVLLYGSESSIIKQR